MIYILLKSLPVVYKIMVEPPRAWSSRAKCKKAKLATRAKGFVAGREASREAGRQSGGLGVIRSMAVKRECLRVFVLHAEHAFGFTDNEREHV